jgi:hypothetical protein
VVRLIADPVPPYDAWRDTALVFAGSDAWAASAPTRKAGRRACTLLPPGSDPKAIEWPRVNQWVGETGDLPAGDVLALARSLIAAGAARVTLVTKSIPEGVLIAKLRPA